MVVVGRRGFPILFCCGASVVRDKGVAEAAVDIGLDGGASEILIEQAHDIKNMMDQ
jgi:hypothetical protein